MAYSQCSLCRTGSSLRTTSPPTLPSDDRGPAPKDRLQVRGRLVLAGLAPDQQTLAVAETVAAGGGLRAYGR